MRGGAGGVAKGKGLKDMRSNTSGQRQQKQREEECRLFLSAGSDVSILLKPRPMLLYLPQPVTC